MSNSLPPVLTTASKLEQAKERIHDLFVDADHARHCAHEAAAALEEGFFVLALQCIKEAEKPAGILAARAKWAELAVTSAKAEADS